MTNVTAHEQAMQLDGTVQVEMIQTHPHVQRFEEMVSEQGMNYVMMETTQTQLDVKMIDQVHQMDFIVKMVPLQLLMSEVQFVVTEKELEMKFETMGMTQIHWDEKMIDQE